MKGVAILSVAHADRVFERQEDWRSFHLIGLGRAGRLSPKKANEECWIKLSSIKRIGAVRVPTILIFYFLPSSREGIAMIFLCKILYILTIIVMIFSPSVASAAPVFLDYRGRVNSVSMPGVELNDFVFVTVALDNGNNTLTSQSFTRDDFISASVTAGSYSAFFDVTTGSRFTVETDASGNLSALDILQFPSGTDSNGAEIIAFAMTGVNSIINTEFSRSISAFRLPTIENTTIRIDTSAIPVPASGLLLISCLVAATLLRRRSPAKAH